MEFSVDQLKISKSIVHAGKKIIAFQPETKTKLTNLDHTVIDDTKKCGKLMQIILGKKFKLPVWEACLQTMALDEVAKFVVDKSLVQQYPFVAKIYRDQFLQNKSTGHRHQCNASLIVEGLGYDDLDKLLKNPQDLEFIFEIKQVEYPGQYEKEDWQISNENKLELIPQLKEEGNNLYKSQEYEKALQKYRIALTYIDQLQLREKPNDTEWNILNSRKLPFLLNIAQCKMCLEDYYAVIDCCNLALQIDESNIKALFRRAKANIKVWNLNEAKEDLLKIVEIDKSQISAISFLMNELKIAANESQKIEKNTSNKKLF